ncbi:MAG: ABC transporter substrate-binding protein [Lachnospiraceae bacterium]|nr:ABC transporter substrate-binding protein [Lachnospiraceae bacterium]
MRKRTLSLLLATALSISLLAGCGSSGSSEGSAASDTAEEAEETSEENTESAENAESAEPVTLRTLAWNSMVGHLDSALAYAAGYYEDEGLNIEMTYNNSNPENIQALLEDKADLVSAGATAVLNYIDEGSDIVIIGCQMSQGASLYSLPERADEFTELSEETLAGKKIGVTLLNTGDIALRKILIDRGVDLSLIEFVELDSQATVVEAVLKGEVDLGIAFLTYRQSAELQGLVPVSYLDGEDEWPGYICCRIFTTREKLEANRDAYVSAMKANIRAYALIQQDEEATVEYALNELEIDEDTLRSQVYEYGHLGLNPNPDIKNTSEFFQAMVDIGYSEGNVDITDYIDASVYEDALNELLEEEPDNEIYLELLADDEATNH